MKKLREDVNENQIEIAEINTVLVDDKENKTLGLATKVENLERENLDLRQRLGVLEKNHPKVFLPENVETYSEEEVDDMAAQLRADLCSKSALNNLQNSRLHMMLLLPV